MYRKSRKKFRQKNVEVKLKNETTERLTVKDSQKSDRRTKCAQINSIEKKTRRRKTEMSDNKNIYEKMNKNNTRN